MIQLLKISFRNFIRNLNRFRILLIASIIAVSLMIVMVAYISGITDLLRLKASRYFSGDIAVQAFEMESFSNIPDPQRVKKILQNLNLPINGMTMRSVEYTSNSSLLFNGYYAKQRRLIGIDWELERDVFEYLDFVEGHFPADNLKNSVLISTATSDRLQARVGDEVTISIETYNGMINTRTLIVKGIFREESFFGYVSYLDRETLNEILVNPADMVNEMGVYLQNPSDQKWVSKEIRRVLESEFSLFPVFENRRDRSNQLGGTWNGAKYAILPLNLQIDEIQDLIDALSMVSYSVFIVFMLIVIIGVSNTYSIIVYERTQEIGTLRALGLTKNKTMFVIVFEALFLGLGALLAGSAGAIGLLNLLSHLLVFSEVSVFSLFLAGNSLPWLLRIESIILIGFISIFASFIGVVKPAYKASNVNPVDAIRQV